MSAELTHADLILLLAEREARLMALADGYLSHAELEAWEGGLSPAKGAALERFDALIRGFTKLLHAAHRAAGD